MVGRHVKFVILGVFQDEVFFFVLTVAQASGAGEPGHAVIDVHHVGAGNKVCQDHFGPVFSLTATGVALFFNRAK